MADLTAREHAGAQLHPRWGGEAILTLTVTPTPTLTRCQLQGGGSKEGCSFYAVYDGHGGARAATFCTEVSKGVVEVRSSRVV